MVSAKIGISGVDGNGGRDYRISGIEGTEFANMYVSFSSMPGDYKLYTGTSWSSLTATEKFVALARHAVESLVGTVNGPANTWLGHTALA